MTLTEILTLAQLRVDVASGRARDIRETAGLSQGDIAECVDVVRSTIALWEQHRRTPRGAAALRYAALLARLDKINNSRAVPS